MYKTGVGFNEPTPVLAMNKILAVTLLFFAFFFVPTSAFADTASDSASCSFLDVGCQICWLFCFPTTWATDQYNDIVASISAKAPFAYIDTAFAFNASQGVALHIDSYSSYGGGYAQANLSNIPNDSAIITCSAYEYHSGAWYQQTPESFNTATDTTCQTGMNLSDYPFVTDTFICLNDTITRYDTPLGFDDTCKYESQHEPLLAGTYADSSGDVLPLTMTIASLSAIPQIGMPAVLGATYTVDDSDHQIHDFMFTWERPIVTTILWVLLIAYFITVARRIFV